MKSPKKLQSKLLRILKGTPALSILPESDKTWGDLELQEVAAIVQDFVNQSTEVIEEDPLKDWIEEYLFYRTDNRTSRGG